MENLLETLPDSDQSRIEFDLSQTVDQNGEKAGDSLMEESLADKDEFKRTQQAYIESLLKKLGNLSPISDATEDAEMKDGLGSGLPLRSSLT